MTCPLCLLKNGMSLFMPPRQCIPFAKVTNSDVKSKCFGVNYLIVCQKVQLKGSGGKARLGGVWSVCGMLARFTARGDGRESAVVAF